MNETVGDHLIIIIILYLEAIIWGIIEFSSLDGIPLLFFLCRVVALIVHHSFHCTRSEIPNSDTMLSSVLESRKPALTFDVSFSQLSSSFDSDHKNNDTGVRLRKYQISPRRRRLDSAVSHGPRPVPDQEMKMDRGIRNRMQQQKSHRGPWSYKFSACHRA